MILPRPMQGALIALLFLLFSSEVLATHNRAGEIIYEHVSGYTYRVTIITITKSSAIADRPYLKIRWGDEPSNILENDLDSLARSLEEPLVPSSLDAQRNEYVGFHTYSGPGIYNLVVEDPNRNAGVVNIANSIYQIFSIKSVLIISPVTGHNNSVQLLNPAKDRACIFQPWIHNPAAFDPDGDSLVYSLISCMGAGTLPLNGWEPPEVSTPDPSDTFTIDSQTGDVVWNVPNLLGEFNIAILIEEFRNGVLVGSVVRDMQINVEGCSNQPPQIDPMPDYCVEAGTLLTFDLNWSDPDNDQLTAVAYGGPMSEVENTATFNTLNGVFNWKPECEEIRVQPYTVSFKVTDNGDVNLSAIETVSITVVAPRVENPTAEALGNRISLTWDVHECAPIFTDLTAPKVVYKIYRRIGTFGFEPDDCELGVPEYTGYVFIGQSNGLNNTSFLDTLVTFGTTYCYMIATCMPDGSISYASEEFCATIRKELPVMTKVSIGVTDITEGVDTIWWSPPNELDTQLFPGPYQYKLYHGEGLSGGQDLIYESTVSSDLFWADTTYIHSGINTLEKAHNYQVAFYSAGDLVGRSSYASSVFLKLTPLDNAMRMDFTHATPWVNSSYEIFRKGPDEINFQSIGVSDSSSWMDTGLINNKSYCYFVISEGSYNASMVPDPLFNYSQQACAVPYDQTPPCPPTLTIESICEEEYLNLAWNNPNNSCADDVTGYHIYYTPSPGQPYAIIATIEDPSDTSFVFNPDGLLNSIAGCFAVTALDSLNLWPDGEFYRNESALSTPVCVDNCPVYTLPNIFTPNNDGANDFFRPIQNRHVADIELRIFNRWGIQVFESTDPQINWNGEDQKGGKMCSDGVYFYTIRVNTIRLSGIEPLFMSGNIQLNNGLATGGTQ